MTKRLEPYEKDEEGGNPTVSTKNLRFRVNGFFTFNAHDQVAVVCGHVATEGAVSPHLGGRPKFWRAFTKLEITFGTHFSRSQEH